jgi:hypothetical protein
MEEHHADDQSHYEISLTAGQAFVAFVLLLLSIAAAFAFGLMIGKGQADERLVVRKETPVVTEASLAPKKAEGKIVELGVEEPGFEADTPATESAAVPSQIVEEGQPPAAAADLAVPAETKPAEVAAVPPVAVPAQTIEVTHYAQLLSTSDQKVAEALAARVIDKGFTTAYVERGSTARGAVFRVRVKFESEAAARAAEPKLRQFSKEVWITSK